MSDESVGKCRMGYY